MWNDKNRLALHIVTTGHDSNTKLNLLYKVFRNSIHKGYNYDGSAISFIKSKQYVSIIIVKEKFELSLNFATIFSFVFYFLLCHNQFVFYVLSSILFWWGWRVMWRLTLLLFNYLTSFLPNLVYKTFIKYHVHNL